MVEFNFDVLLIQRRVETSKNSLEANLGLPNYHSIGVGGHCPDEGQPLERPLPLLQKLPLLLLELRENFLQLVP